MFLPAGCALLVLGGVGGFTLLLPQPPAPQRAFGFDRHPAIARIPWVFGGLVDDYGGATAEEASCDETATKHLAEDEQDDWDEEEQAEEIPFFVLEEGEAETKDLDVEEEETVETSQPKSLWDRITSFFTRDPNKVDWDDSNDSDSDDPIYEDTNDSYDSTTYDSRPKKPRTRSSTSSSLDPTLSDDDGPEFPLPKCSEVAPEILLEWEDIPQGANTVVLVTQCSVDRWEQLQQQMTAWDGFASVALYVKSSEERAFVEETIQPQILGNVAVCLVSAVDEDDPYPINFLRNCALLQGREQYEAKMGGPYLDMCSFLLADVDFVPSLNLQTVLHSPQAGFVLHEQERILVVPAFETTDTIPSTLTELKAQVEQGRAEGFHIQRFPQGHGPTNFDKFWNLSSRLGQGVLWSNTYPVQYREGYEPYIVLSAKQVPLYDERFQGYGLNKISHLATVAATASSTFVVLPEVFLVAATHAPSQDWERMYGEQQDSNARKEALRALWDDFQARLERGDPPIVSHTTQKRLGYV